MKPTAEDLKVAKESIGTVFFNTSASYETLERVVIERVASAIASEREKAAKKCDDIGRGKSGYVAEECAAAIRSQSE